MTMARKLPSLKALRAFEAAARHESFSQAAEELFVTHAAVSRHIRDLELFLKTPLFVRTGRGVHLTEAGRKYQRELTPAFDRMARATHALLEDSSGARLSISVEEAIASRWLVPQLGAFTSRYPDIDLEIDPEDELTDFYSDNADLAVRFASRDAAEWRDVDAELLAETRIFPVCSPELLEKKPVSTPEDLARHTLLHEDSRRWWEVWFEGENVSLPKGARGPMFQSHLALEAAEAGQGFALADQILAYEALREGWLVKPLPGYHHFGAYYLVSPGNRPDTEAVQAFRAWIRAAIAETQAWFDAHMG